MSLKNVRFPCAGFYLRWILAAAVFSLYALSFRGTRGFLEKTLPFFFLFLVGFEIYTKKKKPFWLTEAQFGWCVKTCILITSIVLSTIFLHQKWFDASANFSIGGLVPISDAAGYYRGALRLIEFGQLDEWSSRRPIGVAFYALLLFLSGQNVQCMLYLLSLMTAISVYFVAKKLYRSWGIIAAFLYAISASCFIGPYNGTLLTESAGFIFANFGIGLLIDGFGQRRDRDVFGGLFLLGTALSIRAGAFFVLPCILAAYLLNLKSKSQVVRKGSVMLAIIFASALSSLPMLKAIGPRGGFQYQGNFSYTLYGLAHGGKGWAYIKKTHPRLCSSLYSDGDRNRIIYRLAFQTIRKNPSALIRGCWNTYSYVIRHPFLYLFGFGCIIPLSIFVIPFLLAVFFTFFHSIETDRRNQLRMILFAVIGIAASAPFIADGHERVFASSIQFTLSLLCIGTSLMIERIFRLAPATPDKNAGISNLVVFGFSIIVLFVLPLGLALGGKRHVYVKVDETEMLFRINQDNMIGFQMNAVHKRMPVVRTTEEMKTQFNDIDIEYCMQPGQIMISGFALNPPHHNRLLVFSSVPDRKKGIMLARIRRLNPQKGKAEMYAVDSYRWIEK